MRLSLAKAGLLLGMVGSGAWAQKYVPPPPPLTTAPCVPTKKDPCTDTHVTPATPAAAAKFPFPGDAPGPTPAAPVEKFPFPGEPPAPAPDAASSSSTSSSSSSSSPDTLPPDDAADPAKPDDAAKGSSRFVRKHLPKVEDKDRREEQDLEISRYYASTGNFNAAYLRAKDAVASMADDPEAHFLLGEAAQRMKKNDEAQAEFKTYLQLDGDGPHVKAAHKALTDLGAK